MLDIHSFERFAEVETPFYFYDVDLFRRTLETLSALSASYARADRSLYDGHLFFGVIRKALSELSFRAGSSEQPHRSLSFFLVIY